LPRPAASLLGRLAVCLSQGGKHPRETVVSCPKYHRQGWQRLRGKIKAKPSARPRPDLPRRTHLRGPLPHRAGFDGPQAGQNHLIQIILGLLVRQNARSRGPTETMGRKPHPPGAAANSVPPSPGKPRHRNMPRIRRLDAASPNLFSQPRAILGFFETRRGMEWKRTLIGNNWLGPRPGTGFFWWGVTARKKGSPWVFPTGTVNPSQPGPSWRKPPQSWGKSIATDPRPKPFAKTPAGPLIFPPGLVRI